MKKQLIIGIIVLLITIGLSGCFVIEQGIHSRKLNEQEQADNFVNMTEKQMKNFPILKESILKNKSIDVSLSSEEIIKLRGILEYFETDIICYQNEYYKIFFYTT